MSKYGIPYMGSKAKICEFVCRYLPKANNFYDLFGGGFSISHFMLKHRAKDYKEFHFNELSPGITKLIQDAIAGKYNYNVFKPKWISREEFFAKKENDPYIKLCWSFGNNGESYLFNKELELEKRSLHSAIIFNEFDAFAKDILGMSNFKEGFSVKDKRFFLRSRIRFLKTKRLDLQQSLQLQQLMQLERLERLQQLEQLQRLHFYNGDYRDVPIKDNSVIYCDIPYQGTAGYGKEFSHKDFYNWADKQKEPVFISEYNISDPRFKCIANKEKRSMLSGTRDNILMKVEKIYVNEVGFEKLMNTRREKHGTQIPKIA